MIPQQELHRTSSPSRTRSSTSTSKHQGCIVIPQREVGLDTDSFEVALKNTLRQALTR